MPTIPSPSSASFRLRPRNIHTSPRSHTPSPTPPLTPPRTGGPNGSSSTNSHGSVSAGTLRNGSAGSGSAGHSMPGAGSRTGGSGSNAGKKASSAHLVWYREVGSWIISPKGSLKEGPEDSIKLIVSMCKLGFS